MHPGVQIVPVRTPTLPPATHTNTWVVGEGALTVIDPASPYEDEQGRFLAVLGERLAAGEHVERIVLTHHHHDHVSGAEALRRALPSGVPISAHPATTALVEDRIRVDDALEDGAVLQAGGRRLRALHTPGHAPGHLVFHDLDDGWMIAGDMVAGIGTILLHPDEGDLADYLTSLARMKAAGPTVLLPSHGPDLPEPRALLEMYVAHRHLRTDQIRRALVDHGRQTPRELADHVYPELEPRFRGMAALQITTHLRWMHDHGLAVPAGETRWAAA
jgi:endoribonuclease LACTB2